MFELFTELNGIKICGPIYEIVTLNALHKIYIRLSLSLSRAPSLLFVSSAEIEMEKRCHERDNNETTND